MYLFLLAQNFLIPSSINNLMQIHQSPNSLSQFKLFQKFHLFYYSRKDDQTFFLLRQKKSGSFSEIKGHLQLHDPGILFSAGRKIMELSSGLLTKQNLEFFAENSPHSTVNRDMLQFCKKKQQMVLKSFLLPCINFLCSLVC